MSVLKAVNLDQIFHESSIALIESHIDEGRASIIPSNYAIMDRLSHLPNNGSRLSWEKIPHAAVHPKKDLARMSQQELLDYHEQVLIFIKSVLLDADTCQVYIFEDASSDAALLLELATFESVIYDLLITPAHKYVLEEDSKWLVNIVSEGSVYFCVMEEARRIVDVHEAWQDFLKARKYKQKEAMHEALKWHIESISALAADERKKYVHALLWLRFEQNLPIPLENPRLWSLVFPVLQLGYEARNALYFAWMYRAFSFLGVYDYLQCQPEEDVLKYGLRHHPNDERIARLLVLEYLSILDFGLHELPQAFGLPPSRLLESVREVRNLQQRFPILQAVKGRYGSLNDYEKALLEGINRLEHNVKSNE